MYSTQKNNYFTDLTNSDQNFRRIFLNSLFDQSLRPFVKFLNIKKTNNIVLEEKFLAKQEQLLAHSHSVATIGDGFLLLDFDVNEVGIRGFEKIYTLFFS